jgi:hypothetical protein
MIMTMTMNMVKFSPKPMPNLPPSPNSNRDPLHNPAMVVARRIHTVIHGEIAADQVRAHGGAFTR